MPEEDSLAGAFSGYEDNTFSFTYDMSNITPGQFPDPGLFDVGNLEPETKVAVELQIHSRKFKLRGQKNNKLQKAKVLPPSTPEKRRKEANEFIATPPRTKHTRSALNPLEWIVDEDLNAKTRQAI